MNVGDHTTLHIRPTFKTFVSQTFDSSDNILYIAWLLCDKVAEHFHRMTNVSGVACRRVT